MKIVLVTFKLRTIVNDLYFQDESSQFIQRLFTLDSCIERPLAEEFIKTKLTKEYGVQSYKTLVLVEDVVFLFSEHLSSVTEEIYKE